MTDLDIQTLVAPFDAPHRYFRTMHKRIANFGMELEVMRQGDFSDGEHEEECYCDESCCQGYRYCSNERSEGALALVEILVDAGLIVSEEQCAYHCSCQECRHDRDPESSTYLAFQQDCTVGAEFVSRITDVNQDAYHMRAVGTTVQAFQEWYRQGHWRPDGHQPAGGHIHVSWNGTDHGGPRFRNATRRQASALVNAAYATFDWSDVADGACGRMRSYNSKPSPTNYVCGREGGSDYERSFYGSWASNKGATLEHRLWNMPADPDRLYAHIGISLALTRWAFAAVLQSPQHRWWTADTSPADMVVHFGANREAFIEQVALYLPPTCPGAFEVLSRLA